MELMKLLPDYYEENKTMQELQEIVGSEVEKEKAGLDHAVNQCNPKTAASNGLARHEKIYGINPEIQKSIRYRLERLGSRMLGAGMTTKQLIESIAATYTNAEAEVIEYFSEYKVLIRFVGTSGIPGNIEDIKNSIEEVIPAHLAVSYEYIFNTHGSVGTFTHADLAAYTHYEIRNGHLKNRNQEMHGYQHEELAQLTYYDISKGVLPNGN